MRAILGLRTVLCLMFLLVSFGDSFATSQTELPASSKSSISKSYSSSTSNSGSHLKTIPPLAPDSKASINKKFGKLPLRFEANEGQTAPEVRYLSRGSGYNLYLTSQEAVLVLSKAAQSEVSRPGKMEFTPSAPRIEKSAVVRMQLVGSNKAPEMRGEEELHH